MPWQVFIVPILIGIAPAVFGGVLALSAAVGGYWLAALCVAGAGLAGSWRLFSGD